jgi:hypothetical protein
VLAELPRLVSEPQKIQVVLEEQVVERADQVLLGAAQQVAH